MNELTIKKIELLVKSLTLIGLFCAGIWAVIKYTDTKEKEFYSQYWNTKLELYLETSSWASIMATTTSKAEFYEARTEYYKLFFGQLSLVEGNYVKKAMEAFSKHVPKGEIKTELPIPELDQKAYQLTLKLKHELGTSWETPFNELLLTSSSSGTAKPHAAP